jgi:hypothetical protein
MLALSGWMHAVLQLVAQFGSDWADNRQQTTVVASSQAFLKSVRHHD